MVYQGCKIFGPYTRKRDGRKHVVIQYDKFTLKTVSYPKYLVELSIGRYLKSFETVHHKDEDFTNDDLDNLEVKTRREHCSTHSAKYSEYKIAACPGCGAKFKLGRRRQQERFRPGSKLKSGPFCSRSCAGKYRKPRALEQ